MLTVLFAAPALWESYRAPLAEALAEVGIQANLVTDAAPKTVDYIVYAPSAPLQDFTPYTRTRAVLSLWAGVEKIVQNETLTQPLCRMVDPSLTEGMVEWVTGHVLRHHLGMDRHIVNPGHDWAPQTQPLARERPITILGLGELGAACAAALSALNFPVSGWSRSPKSIDGITCYSGQAGLKAALTGAQGVILLLPRTADTDCILNATTLSYLAKGAFVLNPGRGPLIDDDALLAALETGQIGHATLDVFRTEPLPKEHPFWSNPNITVTPHIAAETRPISASRVIAANIARSEADEALLHLVNRRLGY